MGKWRVKTTSTGRSTHNVIIENHKDGTESWIADVGSLPVAQQIVREHNAHEGLIGLARKSRAAAMVKATNAAFRAGGSEENAAHWEEQARYNYAIVAEIDAVLAEAEGREND